MSGFFIVLFSIIFFSGCSHHQDGFSSLDEGASYKIINSADNCVSGRLIVRLSDNVSSFPEIGNLPIELSVKRLFPYNHKREHISQAQGLDKWYVVSFSQDEDLLFVANKIAEHHDVAIVEFDEIVTQDEYLSVQAPGPKSAGISRNDIDEYPFDDPELPYQWHYMNDGSLSNHAVAGADINLFPAWEYCTGDPRVIVAVIDDGLMYTHEDLADNMWINEAEASGATGVDDDGNGYVDDIYGYNFYDDSGVITWNKPYDIGHGTHVAGTIAAVNNNGKCVSGIAGGSGNGDGCKLMSCQIFSEQNSATVSSIAQAIKYAADNGAVIANNSWSLNPNAAPSDSYYESNYSSYKQAIDYFYQYAGLEGVIDGGIVIFAAGNEGSPTPAYPGAYYSTICVTAMAPDFTAATYTNYGDGSNICAPGGQMSYGTIMGVSSTSIGSWGYDYMQGTSMAAPHVSGCAALGISFALQNGYSFTSSEFKNLLLTSVHDINQYQNGSKQEFDYVSGSYVDIPLEPYQGKLGAGYIDAHLLLMQIQGTPCLYFQTGEYVYLSLDEYFGGGSSELSYLSAEISSADMSALGIESAPVLVDGKLKIKCSKAGRGRIKVTAIVGGTALGGDDKGGMEVAREFEMVVRKNVAENGGWL